MYSQKDCVESRFHQYILLIHTHSASWDDWVPEDRLRKLNDENKVLATNLRNEFMALQRPPKPSISAATKKKTAGSDLSSTRGSEERHASLPATGRGQKRGRDNDIEKASDPLSLNQRRSSSRKRRKTSKAESPPPPPEERTRGKAKADPPLIHPKTRGKRKVSIPPLETEKPTSSDSLPEKSDERTASPSNTQHEPYVLSEESSFDGSKVKPSKLPSAPQKSSAENDSDYSPLSSVQDSLQDPDPGDVIGREQGSVARQTSRKERAEARNARGADEPRRCGAPVALNKDQPRGTRITVAGIPLDETPADLVSFVKQKRQRVKKIDKKIKFTNKPALQQEETFNLRPAIHINVPDHLKSILVDDWENVTKNLSLVPLPSKPSVNEILTSYFDEEKNKRHLGSPEADLLEEVVAGLKEYFEKCLGRILLYRFERQQYLEVYNAVQAGTGEYEGKGMGDIYGAEHLCRLFGKSLRSLPLLRKLPILLHLYPKHAPPTPRAKLTTCLSFPPRTHCPNKHGPAIRQPSPRRTSQDDPMARQKLHSLLQSSVRKCQPGLHREGPWCLRRFEWRKGNSINSHNLHGRGSDG